jgi:ABC-type Fe3+-siderophore transport system permease subunit
VAIWLFEWYSTGVAAFAGLSLAACGVIVFYLTRNRWKTKPAKLVSDN